MVGEPKVTVRSRILGALLVVVGFYALAVIVLRWLGGVPKTSTIPKATDIVP